MLESRSRVRRSKSHSSSREWFLLISLGIAAWLLVDARGYNHPRLANDSRVARGSSPESCHLDTTDTKEFGVSCIPSVVSGVAFFDCNSTDVNCTIINGTTSDCTYKICSNISPEEKFCKVRIKFTKFVDDPEGNINSYDLSNFRNCPGTMNFEIELDGRGLVVSNESIVTGLEGATLSSVVMRDTEFNPDQIAAYLNNNFRSAKKVSLINNDNLLKLSSKTFQNLKELESVVVEGGSTIEIGESTFIVRAKLTEIMLTNLRLGDGKMSPNAITINDPTCRDRDLVINITHCELYSDNLSEEAIRFKDVGTQCSRSTNITIDMRSNVFGGLINRDTFEPLIKYSSANNQNLVVLYDPLKCCKKGNKWFFELIEKERRVFRKNNCSDLTNLTGLVDPSSLEDVDAECKLDQKVLVFIILGVVLTVVLVIGVWVCFGNPKRSVIVLAAHEKSRTGSQNSTSYLKSARSGSFVPSETKHKRHDAEASPSEIIMPIPDHAKNSVQVGKLVAQDDSIATSEGAFIAAKSMPTLSKSSSSGKKLPHAEPKPAITPRSPLSIAEPTPVRTPRSPLFETASISPEKYPQNSVSQKPKTGRHTRKKNKHKKS